VGCSLRFPGEGGAGRGKGPAGPIAGRREAGVVRRPQRGCRALRCFAGCGGASLLHPRLCGRCGGRL
ncbi:MAG: hypothetical protein AVDCRST_MAG37-417, partial [uncultured Rubrobacteraceae bacterium]